VASPTTAWDAWTSSLGTGSGSVPDVLEAGPTPTQTSAVTATDKARQRSELSGFIRTLATAVNEAATDMHQGDYMVEHRVRTSDLAGAGGQVLLGELADLGFAWRDIAKMIGVSVPAIQKWRRGEGLTGENARKLARLVAGCEIIQKFNPVITDIATWFEVPIVDEAPVTPMDLWATGNQQLVFEHARVDVSSKVDPYLTMDSFDPNWRETYRSDFETFRAGDGELSIRARERRG
jgi:transcriptional regulator with XRE-family HTH domain